ncbi:MAG: protease modulator HflK [Verrucomicrobia bacterium]|nr:protease modulator HflK [Verrucomicrobiota bacterium]
MPDPIGLPTSNAGQPKNTGPVSPPAPIDDASTQALAEALRSSFVIVKIIMVILVIVFFGSGFFTVSPQERAIILRFGRAVGVGNQQLLGPGAHWSFPYPIDEVIKIPFSEIQQVASTTGWYATTPEAEATNSEPPPGSTLNPAADGYTLTADTNIIHVRATLSYRINQPVNYVLNFTSATNLIQNALNNALFHASARFSVDDALLLNVQALKEKITARVQQLVDQQSLGITIEQVELRTRPPRYVNEAFENVSKAGQERGQTNQVAQAYASSTVNKAHGEASAIINAGETDRNRTVQEIAAEAKYFTNQLPYYRSNPELFMARLQTEALHQVLTNSAVEKMFVPERASGKPVELRIQLGREPQKPAALPPP